MDEQSIATSSSVGLPPKKAGLGLTTEQYTFTPGEGSPGGASSVTGGASMAPPKRKTLMEQQSEVKGDAFKMAELIITESEKSALKLRNQREKASQKCERIDREVADLMFQIHAFERMRSDIQTNLDERLATRERISNRLAESKKQSDDMMSTCKTWAEANRRTEFKTQARIATQELETGRGYSCGIGTTLTRKEFKRRTAVLSGRTLPPIPAETESAAMQAIANAQALLGSSSTGAL